MPADPDIAYTRLIFHVLDSFSQRDNLYTATLSVVCGLVILVFQHYSKTSAAACASFPSCCVAKPYWSGYGGGRSFGLNTLQNFSCLTMAELADN
jgi:hypothetical protein